MICDATFILLTVMSFNYPIVICRRRGDKRKRWYLPWREIFWSGWCCRVSQKENTPANIVEEKHIDDVVITSERGSVVVAMVVTTVELVKSCIEAWRNIVATARLANTIINHSTFPPDLTLQQHKNIKKDFYLTLHRLSLSFIEL